MSNINPRFVCPDWLIVGCKFIDTRYDIGTLTVLGVDISRNKLEVEIESDGVEEPYPETLDLSITLWNFRNGQYSLIN